MESQPQNPEFRKNPESFHPCHYKAVNQRESIVLTICTKNSTNHLY